MAINSPIVTGILFLFGLAVLVNVTVQYRRQHDRRAVLATDVTMVFGITSLALLWFLGSLGVRNQVIGVVLLLAAGGSVVASIALAISSRQSTDG